MIGASILKMLLLREIAPPAVCEASEPSPKFARRARNRQFQRESRGQADCEDHHLELDSINDVYCKYCGRDFTD